MRVQPFSFLGGTPAAPAFDPATLSLTLWERGSFSGSPWPGTASAGSSGSHDLTESTNPPSTGTAVNGRVPATFNGSNQKLDGTTLSNLMTTSAYLWWALFYSAATGGSGSPDANPGLWTDVGGAYMGCSFHNNSGTEKVQPYHYAGGYTSNEHTISLNTWNLLCVRYDGTNIRSKLNSNSVVVSASVGSVGSLGGPLTTGRNYNSSAFWNGRLLDFGFMASAESDARFDDLNSYVNARYALSL